ncbi:MAG: hypothetical protein K0R14_1864 [Burkholderiales bacterium]|jgi:hypothetical protein|nr:hypothetical protein [Burkholderiales bacterium]
MFEKLFKRPYYIRRHVNAPLLAERIKYLECEINRDTVFTSIQSIAQHLLRIVEFLQLNDDNRIITLEDIETAADKWARHKSKHPTKNGIFSINSKLDFIWYAKDWLKKIKRLEPLFEESIPLFNKIFEQPYP